jgi:hypothetical protein
MVLRICQAVKPVNHNFKPMNRQKILIPILSLVFFILFSCERKWEIISINKFIFEKKIDTNKYKTFDQLSLNSKVVKFHLLNRNENLFIGNHLISNENFIFMERKNYIDKSKIVLYKYDKNFNLKDSLIINKNCKIINDYIFDKNSYCSWFIDEERNFKKLKNFDFFLKSDTTKVKLLVDKIKRNNIQYYSISEPNTSLIDTCNFIILFNKNKIEKYNLLSTIKPIDYLNSESTFANGLSDNFKLLEWLDNELLFSYDNFYARYKNKLIRKGISGSELFNNGGISIPPKSYYIGTYFITLKNQNKFKLKMMNNKLNDLYEEVNYDCITNARIFSNDLINFYLVEIDDNCYIIKK